MNDPIWISSRLAANQRPALERLLFFNENQHRVRVGIERSIDVYGEPMIYDRDGSLAIRVGALDGVQSLFAVSADGRLRGVAVFARLAADRIVVLHLGVEPAAPSAAGAGCGVLLKLMHEIRSTARAARGVDRIELVYNSGRRGKEPRRLAN
ncbi:MAG: hypothetical protein KGI55_10410 [Gammaproteobacteria bacterium]|nr:hypothetical protein [Gammaproteobacteria bacterium]